MTRIESLDPSVKAQDVRLIIGFDGALTVIGHGIRRHPSALDLIVLPRPSLRISGYRDGEV